MDKQISEYIINWGALHHASRTQMYMYVTTIKKFVCACTYMYMLAIIVLLRELTKFFLEILFL